MLDDLVVGDWVLVDAGCGHCWPQDIVVELVSLCDDGAHYYRRGGVCQYLWPRDIKMVLRDECN